ncbi:MAG: hypothetical protein R3A47_04105 [Polyangiales bacterium]
MLGRGDLVFTEMKGDTLLQVAVAGRAGTNVSTMRRLMVDPEEFGKSLIHGSQAKVLERTDQGVRFKWGVHATAYRCERANDFETERRRRGSEKRVRSSGGGKPVALRYFRISEP